jgi:hypothetical protein
MMFDDDNDGNDNVSAVENRFKLFLFVRLTSGCKQAQCQRSRQRRLLLIEGYFLLLLVSGRRDRVVAYSSFNRTNGSKKCDFGTMNSQNLLSRFCEGTFSTGDK